LNMFSAIDINHFSTYNIPQQNEYIFISTKT
jgi:hypothetical protein